jgi:hypothetical protein
MLVKFALGELFSSPPHGSLKTNFSLMNLDWTCLPAEIRDLIFGDQLIATLGALRLVCKR